jgi:pimeloyl-ACP methyl ester carboxylesterase
MLDLRIVVLHPTADPDAWRPTEGELGELGYDCREFTWDGWTGDVAWTRGGVLSALCADASSRLEPGTEGAQRRPVLVGHNAGALMGMMLAGELDAAGVVALAAPVDLSWLMRLGATRPVGWLLEAAVYRSPKRRRVRTANRAYSRMNFARRRATPPSFLAVAADSRVAREWVRRATALLADLAHTTLPELSCPMLMLWPNRGRLTSAGRRRIPGAIHLELPGGHSAHVEDPDLLAEVIVKFCELLPGLPAGPLTDPEAAAVSAQLRSWLADRPGTRTRIAPEIAAAAKWWSDQLRSGHIGGDFGAFVEAGLGFEVEPLADEQIDRYQAALARLCQNDYDEHQGRSNLRCDHFPDGTLTRAADQAGIAVQLRLPTETEVRVRVNGVRVRSGGRERRIWPTGWGLLQLPLRTMRHRDVQRAGRGR